jgi:hypothetical protein
VSGKPGQLQPMAVAALVLLAAWLLLVAGLRTLIQLRRTGDASAPRFQDRPGSPQWWARLLSAVGFACAVAAPLAELAGLDPITILDRTPVRAAGVVLVVLGIAATFAAQLAMGASWRPDVDPTRAPPWSPPGRSGSSAPDLHRHGRHRRRPGPHRAQPARGRDAGRVPHRP